MQQVYRDDKWDTTAKYSAFYILRLPVERSLEGARAGNCTECAIPGPPKDPVIELGGLGRGLTIGPGG